MFGTPQGLLPTSSIFCCRKKSYWEQRLDLPSLSFPQSQAQCAVLSIRTNVIEINNVSIYSRSYFLSMSNQNSYLSAAIDHSHHQLLWRLSKTPDLRFWEWTKCKSLSALQLVFWKDALWSFCLEAWQHHLQSGESQLAFLVLLAFCCLISAVAQLCPTLCDPMDCSMPGFPVLQLLIRSNSSASSWWCYPIISPSVIPFSSCLHSFPASGSFSMSQFFTSNG